MALCHVSVRIVVGNIVNITAVADLLNITAIAVLLYCCVSPYEQSPV